MGGSTPPTEPTPPGPEDPVCPAKVTVTYPNPGGLGEHDKLALLVEGTGPHVLVLATERGLRLGPVAGVPQLQRLIECILKGVNYQASVETVSPGSITCVILRQSA